MGCDGGWDYLWPATQVAYPVLPSAELILLDLMKMEAAKLHEHIGPWMQSIWHHIPKTGIFINIAVRTSHLTGSCLSVHCIRVMSEVLVALNVKSAVFWTGTLCSVVNSYQHVSGTYYLHREDRGCHIYSEDGGSIFLVLNPRRLQSWHWRQDRNNPVITYWCMG